MKAGLTTSVIMHVALLGFGLITLKAPAAFEVADVEALPVDIVPLSEITQIQQGDKKSPARDKPAPLPTERPDVVADARNVGENSVDTDKPATPEAKPKPVDATSSPPPAPEPKEQVKTEDVPKPKAEPKPVTATERAPVEEPKQDVKPDPVKQPEPKPVPVKQPEPAPAPPVEKTASVQQPQTRLDEVAQAIAAEQPEQDMVQLPDAAPAPDARPKPQPPQAESAKAPERKQADKPAKQASSRPKSDDKDFNADEISALLNKQKPSGGGAKRAREHASLGGDRSTGGDKLSQNEMDALRQKLGGCWSIPAGVDDADALKVSVRFRLDPSGMLEGRPEVIRGGAASGPGRTAAESAVRAVQKCAPFNLPADKYDTWSEVVVNFDPSDMF